MADFLTRWLHERDDHHSISVDMQGMTEMKTKKRQPSETGFPLKNDILHALLNSEYRHLSPKLERVQLTRGEVIYQVGEGVVVRRLGLLGVLRQARLPGPLRHDVQARTPSGSA